MTALADWAAMGGYAAYVWSAYGFAVLVLGGVSLQSWRRYRSACRDLDRLQPGARPRRVRS